MEKSSKSKAVFSLEDTLQASKSIVIQTPKTVVFDNASVLKIRNIITDYPEYELSMTKLLNAIVAKWLDEHREELMQHHISNSLNRY
jgi:Fe-S-cluster formation regulator IscX/YfhJ